MADVITRFKLETTQYDSKLREASKKLSDFTKEAATYGNEFSKFTQKNIEAARAFGQVATSATNSKDKVKELVGAFNDVAKSYNALTKEQQQSDFGKALAESMTTLKGRIAEAKQEMNSTGGVLGVLKDKFTVNIDALKLFNVGLTAAKGALDVAKDAFFASEATVDEWGRVMDSSKSLYEGFLTALNTGDISGYLSRIDSIVKAARAAYNELDRLGTMKTIQAPQMSAQQTENERMRMMIQTGRYIAPVDGRKASMQNGQLLTPDQIKRIEQQLQGGMQKVVTLVGNEVKQTGRAIDAVYNRQAQELGMSLKEFRKGTSSMAEFDKRIEGYQKYLDWDKNARTEFAKQGGQGRVDFDKNNPFLEFKKWGTFRVDGDRYNDLVKLIQQRDQQAGQAYSMQSQAYRTMNRAEGVTLRQIMGGGSGGGRSGGGKTTTTPTYAAGSLAEAQAEVQRLTKLWNEAGADVRDQYLQPLIEAEAKVKSMQNAMSLQKEQAQGKLLGGDVQTAELGNVVSGFDKIGEGLDTLPQHLSPLQQLNAELAKLKQNLELSPNTEEYQANLQAIADKEKEIAEFKGTSNLGKDADKSAKSFQSAASAISQVGSALNSIEDPTAKIMGIVAQAIAGVAAGAGQAVSAKDTTSSGWAWIGAAAAITASMIAMISQIHSATGYQNGGVVKGYANGGIASGIGGGMIEGTTYSSDQIPIMANAGEVILNKSQQANLAGQLQGGGISNMKLSATITGEQLRLVLNNNGRRTGRGEYVTTNFT